MTPRTSAPPARPRALALAARLLAAGLLLPACGGEPEAPATGRGLVVLPADPALAELSPEALPALGVRPTFHDFGRVPLGEVVEHAFVLRNTDPRPVAITRLTPDCGCTVPRVVTRGPDGEEVVHAARPSEDGVVATIPPGETAEILVRIDTEDVRRNNVDKLYTVSLATDSDAARFLSLEMHLYVEADFQVTPPVIDLGRVPRGVGAEGRADVAPAGDRGARLLGVSDLPRGLEAALLPVERSGIPTWTLQVRVRPPLELGALDETVTLLAERDGVPALPVRVPVRGMVVRDVAWEPVRLFLRPGTDAAEATITSLDGEPLRATAARVTGDGESLLTATLEPLSPPSDGGSESWRLVLARGEALGDATPTGEVVVELDHPTEREIRIPYAVVR